MKTRLLLMYILLLHDNIYSQSGMVEHYYYVTKQQMPVTVPMAHFTSSNNWYGEVRYNYEDFNTVSVYAGKTFSREESSWSYSATPLIGGLMGTMEGGAVGANIDITRGKVFLSSQSQYAFSLNDKSNKYFFSWSELGYDVLPWLYGGLALQQTNQYRESGSLEAGCTVGLNIKNWTVPLYFFNPFKQQNSFFIIGVNWEWQNSSNHKQPYQ